MPQYGYVCAFCSTSCRWQIFIVPKYLMDQNIPCEVPGGLTLREGITLLEEVHEAGNMVSMDLVEVNPLLGSASDNQRTLGVVKQLLINAFGYYRGGIRGNQPVKVQN